MTYKELFERAKANTIAEHFNDYGPTVLEMEKQKVSIPNTITIWMKNGDVVWYQAGDDEDDN